MRALWIVVVCGCDWSMHRMQQQPRCDVDRATPLLPHASCNLDPPAGVVAVDAPVVAPPLTRALVVRGRDRFDRFCAPCHGVAADGDSYISRTMTQRRPPSLVDPVATAMTDARILTVIEHGYGVMPSYASAITAGDRFAIIDYVRVLQQRVVAWSELGPLEPEARRWLH